MDKILTELLIALLEYLSIEQKNKDYVEIEYSEDIKELIIGKLNKILPADNIQHLKDHVVECSWGTPIVVCAWSGNVKSLYFPGIDVVENMEGNYWLVSIKYGRKIGIKPLEIEKYLSEIQ